MCQTNHKYRVLVPCCKNTLCLFQEYWSNNPWIYVLFYSPLKIPFYCTWFLSLRNSYPLGGTSSIAWVNKPVSNLHGSRDNAKAKSVWLDEIANIMEMMESTEHDMMLKWSNHPNVSKMWAFLEVERIAICEILESTF